MANAQGAGSGGGMDTRPKTVLIGKKYDPHSGNWLPVYGTPPKSSNKTPPKPATTKKTSTKAPAKPPVKKTTAKDTGNDHRGSDEDTDDKIVERVRDIEYDLEGSATIRPVRGLEARQMIDFQGLGINFSGKYFMTTVVHTINRSGYTMELDLLRKGFEWKVATAPPPTNKVQPKKEPAKSRTHTVKKGDTLWAIAKRYYGNGALFTRIVNANKSKIKDPHWIYPGQVFIIP